MTVPVTVLMKLLVSGVLTVCQAGWLFGVETLLPSLLARSSAAAVRRLEIGRL